MLITYPAIVIFVGVELALLYIILRFRRKHPAQVGASWHGNTPLEIVWTVIPALIVAYIAVVSYQVLVRDFTTEAANANSDMNIAVNGVQFSWSYTYDEGFTVQNEMVVPVGKMVHMTFDSDNVIHSWWVPALTGKTDAVPGYTNQSWIKVDPSVLTNCPAATTAIPTRRPVAACSTASAPSSAEPATRRCRSTSSPFPRTSTTPGSRPRRQRRTHRARNQARAPRRRLPPPPHPLRHPRHRRSKVELRWQP